MTKYSGCGTFHIGVDPATNAFHATRFATDRGRPLNFAVTFNWDRLGLQDSAARAAFRALRQKVHRRWTHLSQSWRPPLGSCDDVVSHENPGGIANTHWLLHIPFGFAQEFERTVRRFLRKVVGVEDLGRSVRFQAVTAPGSFMKYMLKGIDPAYGNYFTTQPSDQGFVPGRCRTSVCRSIGRTARKDAVWQRRRRPRS